MSPWWRLTTSAVHWFCFAVTAVTVGILFPLRVSGSQKIPRRGGVLVIANHQSFLDPVILGLTIRQQASYVARSTLFWFPPFRWLILGLRAIRIEREGIGKEGLRECLRRLDAGQVVVVWPEGSRTHDGALAEIKPGILLLLRRTTAPVVIAGISGAFESWPRTALFPWPSPIWVHFDSWKPVRQDSTERALKDLQQAMQTAYELAHQRRHS